MVSVENIALPCMPESSNDRGFQRYGKQGLENGLRQR